MSSNQQPGQVQAGAAIPAAHPPTMDLYSVHLVPVVAAPCDIQGMRALGIWSVQCTFFGGPGSVLGVTDDFGTLVPLESPSGAWDNFSASRLELH